MRTRLFTIETEGDGASAGLRLIIITVRNGPQSTAVSHVITVPIRLRVNADSKAAGDEGPAHWMSGILRGPELAIYKDRNISTGYRDVVSEVTDPTALRVCEKLSR